jgi:hypothetical protein
MLADASEKMEAAGFSEMLARICRNSHFPDDRNLSIHRRVKLKAHSTFMVGYSQYQDYTQHRIGGLIMADEMERVWKEAVVV